MKILVSEDHKIIGLVFETTADLDNMRAELENLRGALVTGDVQIPAAFVAADSSATEEQKADFVKQMVGEPT